MKDFDLKLHITHYPENQDLSITCGYHSTTYMDINDMNDVASAIKDFIEIELED